MQPDAARGLTRVKMRLDRLTNSLLQVLKVTPLRGDAALVVRRVP